MDDKKKIPNSHLAHFAYLGAVLLVASFLFYPTLSAQSETGTSLYLTPSTGNYAVDDTFSVSVYINTGGLSVNAIESAITFPPDKLQIVSPSIGKSVIGVWVGQPSFSNSAGTINFRGAIPNPGLITSQGLISTFTFRVKSVGKAVVKFTDSSKVLLNDGKATNVLSNTSGAIYDLVLPPPQGPIVVSSTNPDQSKWYPNSSVSFSWSGDSELDKFSYVLNSEPVSNPDNIQESGSTGITYADLEDGIHYFHIKAYRDGVWGGVTHFAVKVDQTQPADFRLIIEPRKTTANRKPIIIFDTMDGASGVDYFELKMISLSVGAVNLGQVSNEFFIESTSPYIPELEIGKYDLVLRAFDKAGNYREVKERITILPPALGAIGFLWPSTWLGFLLLLLLLLISAHLSRKYYLWHLRLSHQHAMGPTAQGDIAEKLATLKEYQKKYGHLVVVLTLLATLFGNAGMARADIDDPNRPAPPSVTLISENISNEELFYIGGRHNVPGSIVTIYLQGDSGETSSFLTSTNQKGDWFYSMTRFLPAGEYSVWTQARSGNVESPPSAQTKFNVEKTAFSVGGSRISYQLIFGLVSIISFILSLILLLRAYYYYKAGKKKHALLTKEIEEATASVHRGFAIIRRDIQAELELVKKAKLSGSLRAEEEKREAQLLSDLSSIEDSIGREVWDIKQYS